MFISLLALISSASTAAAAAAPRLRVALLQVERNANADDASAALASVQYCSDQNSVLVHIKVPEEAAPGAKELPHIPVTLKAASCSDAKADMQAAVAKARVA